MYNYIRGTITEVNKDYIVLENNDIGYHILVAHPEDYKYMGIERVFLYAHVKEDGTLLFGFKQKEEKALFLKLIEVTGIGPKTAISMLSATTYEALVSAIETGNTSYLKKLPGIGPKASQQIILDLKGKLVMVESGAKTPSNQALEDAKEALKQLGFKASEVERVIAKIGNEVHSSEEYLRIALKLMK